MKSLYRQNPAAVCVYFLCMLLPVMFGIDPVTAGTGLAAGLVLLFLLDPGLKPRGVWIYLLIPLFSMAVNPVFNHNGVTVLFFLNRNPVTREALLYGLVLGLVISAALVWSRCFTAVMDTDRLLYVTGRLSPKVSLVLSMALRYIPLCRRQAARIREARRAVGLTREDNAVDRLRSALSVFSGLVTWTLENGIVTADSMEARGYGSGRRSRYSLFPWTRGDTLLSALSAALFAAVLAARAAGKIGYVWYPVLVTPEAGPGGIAGYLAFCALCLTGIILEIKERRKWRSLRSEI